MFWDKYKLLCDKIHMSPTAVAKELGLSNATPSHWKNGADPSRKTMQIIADYFGVTVNDLLADHIEPTSSVSQDGTPNTSTRDTTFWNNYYQLCAKENKTPNAIAAELDISSGTVTGWKNGTLPRPQIMQKLCQRFGVSQSQLLSNTDCPSLTDTPAILVRLYEKLNVLYNTPGGMERLQELEETADTWIAKWQTTQQKMEELELLKAKVQQMELELAEEQKLQ